MSETAPGSGLELLRDPAVLRALAHPTRMRIYVAAVREALSAKELAERFEQPLARVSYHVKALFDAGLLEVVSRTPRRGATETHYRAIATLELSEEAQERGGTELRALFAESMLRLLGDDAVHAFVNGATEEHDSLLTRAHFVTSDAGRRRLRAEIQAFYDRLVELEQELWEEAQAGDGPTHHLALGLVFYPGDLRGERNRSMILAKATPGEPEPDTIPPYSVDRY